MPQLAIRLDLDGLDAALVEAAFEEAGAIAISYADLRDDAILEPAPGEFRLWPRTRIEALFDAAQADPTLLRRLAAALGIAPQRFELVALGDRAWEREWLRDFRPMRFGRRLWILPSQWAQPPGDALERRDRLSTPIVVRLDPGLAFGTGTHATTRLCLEWLDERLAGAERLIDYGCGSGVLAIAALALGAAQACAFDIDPQALLATRENAQANGLAERLILVERDAALPPAADLLVANILCEPLCALAPRFAALVRPGGRLVLAGLLDAQAASVIEAQAPWFEIGHWRSLEGWSCLEGVRSGARAARE